MNILLTTWVWGNVFTDQHLFEFVNGLRKALPSNGDRFDIKIFSDKALPKSLRVGQATIIPSKDFGGCTRRIEMFSQDFQTEHFSGYDLVINFDLDVVFKSSLAPVIEKAKEKDLTILAASLLEKGTYNGSLLSLKPGTNLGLWDTFTAENFAHASSQFTNLDQDWYQYALGNSLPTFGPEEGVHQQYGFAQFVIRNKLPAPVTAMFYAGLSKEIRK